MDKWRLGDPADWGNNIGVPDIPYMDYLKDEDEEYETERLRDFRFSYQQFHAGFIAGNYEISFGYLKEAFDIYEEMNDSEKSQLSDNPFMHSFSIELCSKIYNMRDERQNDALEILNNLAL